MVDKMRIMIVDDQLIVRESFLHWFERSGHQVTTAASAGAALEALDQAPFDLAFVDIKMPGMDGIELLEIMRNQYEETIVVIITAFGSIESAVEAMKLGAADYLLKPFKPDQLALVMEKVARQKRMNSEYNYLRGRIEKMTRFENIVGQSASMQKIFDLIPDVAQSDASVLLTGETGTGKELVARAIHAKSRRANFPFIAINCGAIPESLMESELFGHSKGAFTGAIQGRKGFLELVDKGTLFLDEVGEIPLKMQVDLLRVLEEKRITRVGSSHPLNIDFRLVTATSRDLAQEISNGRFREDFFYRINVIQVPVPPLRERREDIPLLVNHFIDKYSHETTKKVDRVAPSALQLLSQHDWPGNVRELQNAVERAVVLSKARTLKTDDFSFLKSIPTEHPMELSLLEVEKNHIRRILDAHGWNITRAASVLGINRTTLHKKINRYRMKRTETV